MPGSWNGQSRGTVRRPYGDTVRGSTETVLWISCRWWMFGREAKGTLDDVACCLRGSRWEQRERTDTKQSNGMCSMRFTCNYGVCRHLVCTGWSDRNQCDSLPKSRSPPATYGPQGWSLMIARLEASHESPWSNAYWAEELQPERAVFGFPSFECLWRSHPRRRADCLY